ncbi:hypothetical protein BT69DRAFT_1210304 [Atractiella rhizophila]|nr:hypothetical protein BT69DRAFT_1210304 [Atractiella rhizophila]
MLTTSSTTNKRPSPTPNPSFEGRKTKKPKTSQTTKTNEEEGVLPVKKAKNRPEVKQDKPYLRPLPPDLCLYNELKDALDKLGGEGEAGEGTRVWWIRNKDLRLHDNHALSLATRISKNGCSGGLIALYIISPSDYKAHDRSPRRIDFMLRNLSSLREDLHALKVPLVVKTVEMREDVPTKVVEWCEQWTGTGLYGNIEHEVDELRRDIRVLKIAKKKLPNLQVKFVDDHCAIAPLTLLTKQGKPYTVYSPWYRSYISALDNDPSMLDPYPEPKENADNSLMPLDTGVPDSVDGWQLEKKEMEHFKALWPAGEEEAWRRLDNFVKEKVGGYEESRDRTDMEAGSKLSTYISSGVVSIRQCLKAAMKANGGKLPHGHGDGGAEKWFSELAWRDFYQHILAAYPRVSMGRAFQEKYDHVIWEDDEEADEGLRRWKEGKVGYPLVDAAMRMLASEGWMHNRLRMNVAMFLSKDMMIDWREGEKWFMQNLIDGDLGSNNGGWQWSASTGCDPQPYFRIFNPLLQSEKFDPEGNFIRRWIPELKNVKGKAIHDPFHRMDKDAFRKTGYAEPWVEHKVGRERALARFKE